MPGLVHLISQLLLLKFTLLGLSSLLLTLTLSLAALLSSLDFLLLHLRCHALIIDLLLGQWCAILSHLHAYHLCDHCRLVLLLVAIIDHSEGVLCSLNLFRILMGIWI